VFKESIFKGLLGVATAVGMAGAMLPAQAGTAGNGTAGTGFSQYTYEADANRLCKGDTVVWGSAAHRGIYYVKGVGPKHMGGYYACMADVKKAGYKIEK
jgi:hypothetical protein